ncbi:MAG: hypothetical protein AAGA09_00515 [Pseudomonadota bacterium]
MKNLLKSGATVCAIAMGTGLSAAGSADAATFTAEKISFRDITGAVEIRTHSGGEIEITIEQGKEYTQVALSEVDGTVIVRGEKWKEEETRDCCNTRINREFYPREGRELTTGEPVDEGFFGDYPTIVVSTPLNSDIEFIDARIKLAMERLQGALSLDACYVYGETSDVEEAVIGVIHGSRLVVGNIDAGLEIDVSGDADVMTGDAATVDVDIAGPGDVILGSVDGMLDVSIAGSGLVRTARLDGPLTTRIAGSGAVVVAQGNADRLRATIDGSGGVFFDGNVTQPELRLFGSSEVRMKSVSGRITHHGGGAVYVGGERVEKD